MHSGTPIFHQQLGLVYLDPGPRIWKAQVSVRAGDEELLLFHHLSLNPAPMGLQQFPYDQLAEEEEEAVGWVSG